MGRFRGGIGLAFQFMDPLFHFLTRLERHHKLFWDKDFLTCAGITCLSSGSSFDLEDAEIAELNPLFIHQRFDNCVERLLDDFLRLQLRETDLF